MEEDLANSPDIEMQDTDFMTKTIAGGLNKQKTTGQTTTPIINRDPVRQFTAEETRLFDLYKNYKG